MKNKYLINIVIQNFLILTFIFNSSCSVLLVKQMSENTYTENNLISKNFIKKELVTYPIFKDSLVKIKLLNRESYLIKEIEKTLTIKEQNWFLYGLGLSIDLLTSCGLYFVIQPVSDKYDNTLNKSAIQSLGFVSAALFIVLYPLVSGIWSFVSLNSKIVKSNEQNNTYIEEILLKGSQVQLLIKDKIYIGSTDENGIVTFTNISFTPENLNGGEIKVLINEGNEINGKISF